MVKLCSSSFPRKLNGEMEKNRSLAVREGERGKMGSEFSAGVLSKGTLS